MLLAPLPVASAQQPSWTPLYSKSSGPSVDRLHVQQDPTQVVVYVTGPGAEIERRSTSSGRPGVPPQFLPPAGVSARFFVSPDGTRLGRADYLPERGGVRTRFKLFEGEGSVVGEIERPRHAVFFLGDDGATIVAVETGPAPERRGHATVYEGDGTPRQVPWAGDLAPTARIDVQLSGDGRRLAVSAPDGLSVYDCTGAGPDAPLYRLPTYDPFHLSRDGARLAVRDRREVVLYQEGVEVLRVATQGPPLDVAFRGARWAAILEGAAVHLVDFQAGPVVHRHAAPAGAQYRSVAIDGRGPGSGVRVALGVRRPVASGLEGWMEVLAWRGVTPPSVESWPAFPFQLSSASSPRVGFLPEGRRALVSTRDRVLLSSEVR